MEKSFWKLTLAYDGSHFHGWQVQAGGSITPTVQGNLANAIAEVTGEQVLPQGAGRTDAGVHALAQVASFSLCARIPAANFQHALNRVLPPAIRILSADHAHSGFHARHSAVGKVYQYRVFLGSICPPFLAPYVAYCRWPLNVDALREAAQKIVGEHDFTSFAATDPDRTARASISIRSGKADCALNMNVRRIDQSEWLPLSLSRSAAGPLPGMAADYLSSAQIWVYTVRGSGFLHHMVRNLVGTFLEIGRGRVTPDALERILQGRDRRLAGPTAPAQGLYLTEVLY